MSSSPVVAASVHPTSASSRKSFTQERAAATSSVAQKVYDDGDGEEGEEAHAEAQETGEGQACEEGGREVESEAGREAKAEAKTEAETETGQTTSRRPPNDGPRPEGARRT